MATYNFTVNNNGGTGGPSTGHIYFNSSTNHFSLDGSTVASSCPIPTRKGYKFTGYSQGRADGSSIGYPICDSAGRWISYFSPFSGYNYAVATWKAYDDRVLTLDPNGGSVSPTSKTVKCDSPVGELPTPVREGYDFSGWFTSSSGGTQITSTTDWPNDADGTAYAHWTKKPILTFDPSGGSVSPSSIYCTTGQPIGQLPEPTYSPNRFLGWFTASTGGTKVTQNTTYSWTTDKTIYAHWEAPHTLTFNPTGGQTSEITRNIFTGDAIGTLPTASKSGYFPDGWWTEEEGGEEVTPETTYDWTTDKTFYAHWTLAEQWNLTFAANGGTVSPASKRVRPGNAVGELPTPEYDGREFLGWFTQPSGGDQWDEDTVFDYHNDVTLYAHWFRYEYTLRFDPNGGTVDETERTVTINEPIGELPEPTKYANTFLGWFTARYGGEQWDEDTVFERTDDTTIYAHWDTDPDYVRTISLNSEGGTVSPTTVSCTYGIQIDYIPIPVKSGKIFLGWFTSASGGTRYTAGMTCDWSGTLTLHAHWSDDVFGNLTDWFGLETPDGPLMLVDSEDGATRSVTETSHSGALAIQTADSPVGAFERGGILMNPTCIYRIRKSGTVQIKAGKAYGSATITGTGTASNPYRATKSGYMLVQAEYATSADGEPLLVVRGTANEGYVWTNGRMVSQLTDAINQWTVNLTVNPDHIAQDPMNAVSGGGEMTECKTLITCDPVVPIEGGMPCASDVVHGKVVVTATTNAYLGESAPTASGSFVEINGDPNSETDVDFTTYAFKAERSL